MDRKETASFELSERRSAGLGRTRLFHPWAHEPEGGGQAPAFRVARCRTQSGVRLDGLCWVPSGYARVSYMVPYISRTLIRDNRVIRQGSSSPVGP